MATEDSGFLSGLGLAYHSSHDQTNKNRLKRVLEVSVAALGEWRGDGWVWVFNWRWTLLQREEVLSDNKEEKLKLQLLEALVIPDDTGPGRGEGKAGQNKTVTPRVVAGEGRGPSRLHVDFVVSGGPLMAYIERGTFSVSLYLPTQDRALYLH
ncbi:hypothetical protein Ancab_038264 [Ancistrocladus abbreviatus]